MLKTASKPVDVQDLQFKLQCRLKIFGEEDGQLSKSPRSLLASASRYGLVFVGSTSSKLKAIRFENIEEHSSTDATNIYLRREINLVSQPHFICVNCDDTILAVVVERDSCLLGLFYDVLSFYKEEIVVLNEVRLSCTPGIEVLQANWHPTVNNIFTECKSDGTLGIYEVKGTSVDVKKLPAESKACCFCWSPKGKQIAVGSQDGKIIHYKPDLKAVKSIDAPPFDVPHSVLSLQWISNYQFVGVFKVCQGSDPECNVVLIDAPKVGNPVFTNFYDICYSNGNARPTQFYTINQQQWNILLVASANSIEVGVLSNVGETWTQLILPDSARAELPLDKNQDETFPIGMTMDVSSVKPVLWGESYIRPAPSLVLLSHEGVLCSFRMINLKEGSPDVNSAPVKVDDLSGLKYFFVPEDISPVVQNHPEESQKVTNSTPTSVAATTSASSIIQSAAETSRGSQIPTTPLSIFKTQPPAQSSPYLPTNLFGGQITITPLGPKKEPTGTVHLSQIATEGAPKAVGDKGPKPSIDSISFSSLLAGSGSAETNANNSGVGSSALTNLLADNNRGEVGYRSDANSTPTHNQPVHNAAATNVSFGSRKTNVPHPTANTTPQPPIKPDEKNDADISNMLTEMLRMESTALDEEIRDLILQGQHLKINLNMDEMDQIVHATEGVNEFLKELVETCEVQSSEIHVLKQTTIQSWAWLEEARSRFKESQDEELRNIIRSKPLDSVSEKHRSGLKQMQYYLNSQMTQSHKALDDQWEKFQDYCRKTNRLQLPTMEAIFQTMVKQNAILQRHNYILKDIKSQIKGRQKASGNAALFNPADEKSGLEKGFQSLRLEPEGIYHIYHQKILNRVKSLPGNKVNQLRRMLHNRDVPHVAVKSQMSASIVNSTLKLDQYAETPKKTDFVSSPLSSTPAPRISSTPLSAFASTNNVTTGGKPVGRLGAGSQVAATSRSGTGDSPVNPVTSAFSGDKSSGVLPSLFSRNPSANYGRETGGFLVLNQGSTSGTKSTSMTTTTPLVSTTSTSQKFTFSSGSVDAATSLQSNVFKQSSNSPFGSSPATKPFSFISSAVSQSISVSSSSAVGVASSSKDGLATTAIVSSVAKSDASSTFSFATPKATFASTASMPSGLSVNFGIGSSFPKSTTQSPSSNNPTNPSTASTNDGALPTKFGAIGTGKEAVQITATSGATSISSTAGTTTPKLQLGTTNVGFFSATKPSVTSTATTSISIFGSSSNKGTSAFGTSATNGGSLFGTVSTSAPASSTVTPSTFGTGVAPTSSTEATVTSASSIFANAATSATSSIQFRTTSTADSPVTATKSIFATSFANSAQSPSIFGSTSSSGTGSGTSSVNPVQTKTKTVFGNSIGTVSTSGTSVSSTSTSVFATGSTTAPSLFGTAVSGQGQVPATKPSIFGSADNGAAATSTKSIFGAPVANTAASTTSIFGTASAPKTTASAADNQKTGTSIFGGTSFGTAQVSTASTTFGNASTSSPFATPAATSPFSSTSFMGVSSSNSVFGQTTATATAFSATSVATPPFGGTTSVATSPFGGTTSVATSPFGGTTSVASSPFGGTTSVVTSPFGGTTSVATSPFGGTTSVATSPFGGTTSVATSPFGGTTTVASSPFGGTTSVATSPFGGTTTVASSPFGGTTTAATSPFGGTTTLATSPFGGASAVANSPFGSGTKPNTSDSLFGGTTIAVCSPFGSAQTFGTGFNSNTTTPSSPFGQVNPSTNAFGSTESAFGHNANNSGGVFGAFAPSGTKSPEASFGFGNLNVGKSSQSPFSKTNENKSPFGGASFNPTTATGSLFGNSNFGNGNSVFGQSTFGGNSSFGSTQQSGPFSGGGGSIAQTGFGVSQNSEKTPAFGSAPSFGGSPAFGAAPTFGGAPAFGSTTPFGGTSKIFGSPSSTPAGSVFGSNSQQSSGFGSFGNQNSLGFGNLAQQTGENLTQNAGFGTFASQNTIGFGNLAQKSNDSGQSTPFSGHSSFSSWR